MLESLHIENIAVIRSLEWEPEDGLCILTGETGAGKSLLIDSINCLLGGRVSRELIRAGEEKASVSAVFSAPEGEIARAVSELVPEIETGDGLMLSRTIGRDGRSVSRINGRAVTQGMLRDVGALLINIHGQTDNQKLMQRGAHGKLLDDFDHDEGALSAYRAAYTAFRAVERDLGGLRQDESERLRTREMLAFQVADIDAAKLRPGEEEKLTERRDKLLHLEKINRQVNLACRVLADGEKATVMSLCDRAEAALSQIAPIIPECDGLMERLLAIRAEAEDIADRVRSFGDEDVGDPTAELDRLEGRLDTIRKLSRKYGEDIPAILAFRDGAAARMEALDTADERIAALEAEEKRLTREMETQGALLTASRRRAARELSRRVQESLAFLDMPRVRFEVSVSPPGGGRRFGADGMDDVEFLIATNGTDTPGALSKIASGGELSRIMLAIRSVLNERYGVPTAIYDEVDTGISGRTARKVGIKLSDMAAVRGGRAGARQQIICVTHSAQIASLADAHYVIEKREVPAEGGAVSVETTVRPIADRDRVEEIARILGGLDITEAQREAARELIAGKEAGATTVPGTGECPGGAMPESECESR